MGGKVKHPDPALRNLFRRLACSVAISIGLWVAVAYLFGSPWLALVGGIAIAAGWAAYAIRRVRQMRDDSGEGEVDEQGYRHSTWVWRGDDDKVECEIDYQHGDMHGTCAAYYPDGKKSLQIDRENGKPHGAVRLWYENGQLALSTEYVRGELDGPSANWNEDGVKTFEGRFEAGWPQGTWTWWHDNGERWVRGEYVMGTPHDQWTEWDEHGEQQRQTEYIAGVQRGPARRYFGRHNWYEYMLGGGPIRPPLPAPMPRLKRWLWTALLVFLLLAFVCDVFLIVPLVLLSVVIGVHELGHFLAAKLVGIPIQRFRVGFGPRLWARLYRGTEYEFGLVPLLGYVKEAELRPAEWAYARSVLKARRRGEPEPPYPEIDPHESMRRGSDLAKPPLRLLYYLGGVTFNFLLAAAALWGTVRMDDPEYAMGPLETLSETAEVAYGIITLLPKATEFYADPETWTSDDPSLLSGMSKELREAIAGQPVSSQPPGAATPPPVSHQPADAAAQPAPDAPLSERLADALYTFLDHLFFISLILVVFNLLPIPPLDGAHCVTTLVEMVLGPELTKRVLLPFYAAGVIIVGLLIMAECFFMGRDLLRAILP